MAWVLSHRKWSRLRSLRAKVFHSPYGTGVAIVTGSCRFTVVTNIEDLKLRRLPAVPGGAVVLGRPHPDRQIKVLLASGHDLYVLDNTGCNRCGFPVEDPCVCVGEIDGVRIISSTHQELLQEVPLVCQDIFKIASMAPGALLLEAHREYEKCSQKADEYLREVKEESVLEEAVRQCVEAAAHEYDSNTQRALLRVQQKDLSDEAISRAVCVKVGDSPGVSYSHIAAKAFECGRTELAIKATMEALLASGLHKQAEQLYRDFKGSRQEAFVDVCMKRNNRYEAKKYVSKVTPEQRVKAHLAVSDLEGAADAAIERRNEAEMAAVLSRCPTSERLLIDRLTRAKSSAARK
ncbi:unnamed protein product [Lampetra planeri]